jgi:hypothetical protein
LQLSFCWSKGSTVKRLLIPSIAEIQTSIAVLFADQRSCACCSSSNHVVLIGDGEGGGVAAEVYGDFPSQGGPCLMRGERYRGKGGLVVAL